MLGQVNSITRKALCKRFTRNAEFYLAAKHGTTSSTHATFEFQEYLNTLRTLNQLSLDVYFVDFY